MSVCCALSKKQMKEIWLQINYYISVIVDAKEIKFKRETWAETLTRHGLKININKWKIIEIGSQKNNKET